MFKTAFTVAQQVALQVVSGEKAAVKSQPMELSVESLRQVGGGATPVDAPKHGW